MLAASQSSSLSPTILSVSALNAQARYLLEHHMGIVWLVGELSNVSTPSSGHWYFTLKDDKAQVKCAMFKGQNRTVSFRPKAGQQVLIRARVSLYEPRGDYQIIAESMQLDGHGQLQQAFETLKLKLSQQGLFDQSHKQPLPTYASRIGIITSSSAAALFDILNVLRRRDPSLSVIIYPAMVQGEGAAEQLMQAIETANQRKEVDVLILSRGGGSLEDLYCFNHEQLAHCIYHSQLPIISAVGHEVDVTIADFVADVRAPTPSAAAELVSQDVKHKHYQLQQIQQRLLAQLNSYLLNQQQQLTHLTTQLKHHHPQQKLRQQAQQIDELAIRLQRAIDHQCNRSQQQLSHLQQRLRQATPTHRVEQQHKQLQQLQHRLRNCIQQYLQQKQHQIALSAEKLEMGSPLATLKRGYSISQSQQGQILTSAQGIKKDDILVTQFVDGLVHSRVID